MTTPTNPAAAAEAYASHVFTKDWEDTAFANERDAFLAGAAWGRAQGIRECADVAKEHGKGYAGACDAGFAAAHGQGERDMARRLARAFRALMPSKEKV